MEKALKALLATEEIEVSIHSEGFKQFNFMFIFKGDGTFTPEDYKKIKTEQIRNISDYNVFYIASKEEARQHVEMTVYLVQKTDSYINGKYMENSCDEVGCKGQFLLPSFSKRPKQGKTEHKITDSDSAAVCNGKSIY